MNDTLNAIDPNSVGDVMHVGAALATDPSTVVGRWTNWGMTDASRQSILEAYATQGWRPLKGSEGQVHLPGDTVPAWGTQRFWLFDGNAWHQNDALASLGLVTWQPPGDE